MVTLKQTLLRTREWSIERMESVKPIGDKDAIYKEFEEWIVSYNKNSDEEIISLAYIGDGSEYDI